MYTIHILAVVVASAIAAPAEESRTNSYSSYVPDSASSSYHTNPSPALYSYSSQSSPSYVQPVPLLTKTSATNTFIPASYHSTPLAVQSEASGALSHQSEHYEEHVPAKYRFSYVVEDSHTGDYHSQEEHRDGDRVVGQYSLREADGTIRIVKYSDDGHGFHAVVEKQGEPTKVPSQGH